MLTSIFLLCSLAFAESKTLAVQIALDREGFSCNAIDGVWGPKAETALVEYQLAKAKAGVQKPLVRDPESAYDVFFADGPDPFRLVTVTAEDLEAIVKIPETPAAKAELPRMGYESVKEMFAERGHLSQRALERMNPGVDWEHVQPGLKLVIPSFPSISEELSVWPKRKSSPKRPEAALVKVTLSTRDVRVFDRNGKRLAYFPCSIARNKEKRPSAGELKIVQPLARPNYTYTPDFVPKGTKMRRYVLPEGENCPIGVAWLGLNLPGYGIHGTPKPETIGTAESHGCFRLSNWNAARLYALCPPGTRVIVED